MNATPSAERPAVASAAALGVLQRTLGHATFRGPPTGIVGSPVIALMQDLVDAPRQTGVRAAFLNSSFDRRETRAAERALLFGELDLPYVAPERLMTTVGRNRASSAPYRGRAW